MVQKKLMEMFNMTPSGNPRTDYFRIKLRLQYEGLTFEELCKIPVKDFYPLPLRKFGVEIEGFCRDKWELRGRLEASGIRAQITGYNGGKINTYFAIGTDSSLSSSEDDGEAIEITSPQLIGWGDKGFQVVKKVLEEWNEIGGKVNRTCGVHVHVDTWDFRRNDYLKLAIFMFISQPFLFAILPQSRWENSYCKLLNADIISKLGLRALLQDRYRVLNFRNIEKNHVEFRLFNGSLNASKIEAYTLISLEIVEAVKTRWNEVKEFLKKIKAMERIEERDTLFLEWLDLLNIKGTHPVRARVRQLLMQRYEEYGPRYFNAYGDSWRTNPKKALEIITENLNPVVGKGLLGTTWNLLVTT
ncbi:MAG: amidoligase family protein [Nanopusillaceae archaeon]